MPRVREKARSIDSAAAVTRARQVGIIANPGDLGIIHTRGYYPLVLDMGDLGMGTWVACG